MSSSIVPSGSFAKASSSGAKIVKGPAPLSVSINSAAWIAANRFLKEPSTIRVLTISPVLFHLQNNYS